nr:unnamed protein product [Callosobruchus chinensis]
MICICLIFILLITIINKCQAEVYAIPAESQFYFEKFDDAPALFGPSLADGAIRGLLIEADPPSGCNASLRPPPAIYNDIGKWILLVPRHTEKENCSFEQKIRNAQAANYSAVIVYNIRSDELIPMAAGNKSGIRIPSVFVGGTSGIALKRCANPEYFIVITGDSPFNIQTQLLIPFAIVVGICFIVMIAFMIVKFIKDRRRQRRYRLPTSALNKIPTRKYQKGDPYETCAICLDDYIEGEKIRVLPCNHAYHSKCIDPWLTKNRRVCPICKRKVFAQGEPHHDSDSDTDSDNDTTPLINSNNRGTQGGTFEEATQSILSSLVRAHSTRMSLHHRSISQQSGAGTIVTIVTTSDRHSINGDYHSISSNTQSTDSSETEEGSAYDSLEVHVHNPDTQSEISEATTGADVNTAETGNTVHT